MEMWETHLVSIEVSFQPFINSTLPKNKIGSTFSFC